MRSRRRQTAALPDCDIVTVQEMGWAGIKNGDFLRLAEKSFDVFITSDKNIRYQQNPGAFDISVILLRSYAGLATGVFAARCYATRAGELNSPRMARARLPKP